MHKAGLVATTAAIVLAAGLATGGGAQPHAPGTLAQLGNRHWDGGRCFDAAMNYYALLQQPPRVLGNNAPLLNERIRLCRQALARVGTGGMDGKADTGGRPPNGDRNPIVLPPPPATDTRIPASPKGDTLASASTEGDNPADPPRVRVCRRYATTAVEQMRMLRNGRCDLQDLRTRSFDYASHYDWCTQRAAPLAVQNEATSRARALNACLLRW